MNEFGITMKPHPDYTPVVLQVEPDYPGYYRARVVVKGSRTPVEVPPLLRRLWKTRTSAELGALNVIRTVCPSMFRQIEVA